MTIHFLRHGLTQANEKQLYYGSTDLPLSEQGVGELQRLRETLALPAADCHVTSGLRRAKESLHILFGVTPQQTVAELNEYDFGDFEMKSYEELKHDPAYLRWIAGDDDTLCPGGESRNQFAERVTKGFEIVRNIKADRVLVVCHGGVISTLMEQLFPGQKNHYYEWIPECGRGFTVEISGRSPVWKAI